MNWQKMDMAGVALNVPMPKDRNDVKDVTVMALSGCNENRNMCEPACVPSSLLQ